MTSFSPGDSVVVNGSRLGVIKTYDEDADRLVVVTDVNGSKDTLYAHISQTTLSLIESAHTVVEDLTPRDPDDTRDGVTNTENAAAELGVVVPDDPEV